MAYENVDEKELFSSLCKLNDIISSKYELKRVSNSLNSRDWSEHSMVVVKNALDEMCQIYDDMGSYFSKCKFASNLISNYKKQDQTSKLLEDKIKNKNLELLNSTDDLERDKIEKKISFYKKNIETCNKNKNDLKIKINSLIN